MLCIYNLYKFILHPSELILFSIGLLFFTIAIVLLNKKKLFISSIFTVIVFQIIIVVYWEEAKYGTFINLVILLFTLPTIGDYFFSKKIQNETIKLFKNVKYIKSSNLNKSEITHLPEIIQKWIVFSGALEQPKTIMVKLQQRGEMKLKPKSKWMPFNAQQIYNCTNPSFIWSAYVKILPNIYFAGRDKFIDGRSEMQIKLLSLISIVNQKSSKKLNLSAMHRFLAEICWFPSVAINSYIKWETIDAISAKAIMTYKNKQVSGVFKFKENGALISFEADRFYGGKDTAQLKKWFIEILEHKQFNNITIPNKCKVTWKLNEGDFNWLNLEITKLTYNNF